jgi:hypothetical protein
VILHPDACLEVRFGFKKKIDSLSEGSVPVIFISMVPPEKSQDKEKFRSAQWKTSFNTPFWKVRNLCYRASFSWLRCWDLTNATYTQTRFYGQSDSLSGRLYHSFNSLCHQQSCQVDTRLFHQTNWENYSIHETLSDG